MGLLGILPNIIKRLRVFLAFRRSAIYNIPDPQIKSIGADVFVVFVYGEKRSTTQNILNRTYLQSEKF